LVAAFAILITLIPGGQGLNPLHYPGLLAQLVIYLIVGVTLGIALLRMKNWSRWLAVTVSAAQLLDTLYVIAIAHSSIAIGRLALRTLFAVGVIWYLTRPHVKAAFQSA
jgi:ABC-type proline/glycine betaine transport system permease subunit